MEALDAASRQSVGLPSINHLDSDRIKREEGDYQPKHSAPAMASPSHPYAGPPQHYSNHQSSAASSVPGPLGGLLSPPESRRTSGDEKEPQRAPARQSLPSIHEALGADQPLPSLSAPAPPPSAPVSAPQQHHPPPTSNSAASPSEQRPRPYQSDIHASQGPPNPFSHPRSPFVGTPMSNGAPPPPPPPPHQNPSESLPRPSFSEHRPSIPESRQSFSAPQHNPKYSSLHPLRTTQSPSQAPSRPNLAYPSLTQQPSSSSHESSTSQSAGTSMNFHFGHPQFPQNYPFSAPAPSGPHSAYPPSATTYSAPPRYPPSWRDGPDMARLEEKKLGRNSLAPYGESVKRHLETFDIEASLNEMAEGSGTISDFSRVYRQRAHENPAGMPARSMPRLEEVDEMLRYSEKIQVSLHRMRELVHSQHQAHMVDARQDPRYGQVNGYDHETGSNYGDDAKVAGSFGGPDAKKRRGRAAPPGRCHSCNRAETPEWRRGPDGARTLCNACGLHYAKLTRKMGSSNNKNMTSSNLRPKSLDHNSPS